MINFLLWIPPFTAIIAFGMAYYFFTYVKNSPHYGEHGQYAELIKQGTIRFLKPQIVFNAKVFIVVLVLMAIAAILNLMQPVILLFFILGGIFSVLAALAGLFIAPLTGTRILYANQNFDLARVLKISYRGGLSQGLIVVGLGLLFVWLAYFLSVHSWELPAREKGSQIALVLLSFGFGASLNTLLTRISTGIFAKTADITADTISNTTTGMHEDDLSNPATLADAVGDNLTDAVAMGVDYFETYVISMIAAVVLGAIAFSGSVDVQMHAILLPMIFGSIAALISVFTGSYSRTKRWATQKNMLNSLIYSQYMYSVFIIIVSFVVLYFFDFPNPWGLWGALSIGTLLSLVLIKITERSTSEDYGHTQFVTYQAFTSVAHTIIGGLGSGMISTFVLILALTGGIIASYATATLTHLYLFPLGMYGIALTGLAMLAPISLTIAANLMSPVADQALAAGNLTELSEEEQNRLQAFDSLGNTTAAVGKNITLVASVISGIAIISAYVSGMKAVAVHNFNLNGFFIFPNGVKTKTVEELYALTDGQLLLNFNVFLSNPFFILGALLGALTIMFLSGKSIVSVAKLSSQLIEEMRFKMQSLNSESSDPGLWMHNLQKLSRKETVLPVIFALAMPVVVTLLFGVAGVLGLMVGTLVMGFMFLVFLASAGAIFDNAKKLSLNGVIGKDYSEIKNQVLIADSVGDPLKDTAAPMLNALIKLVLTISVVMTGVTVYMDSKQPPKPLDHHLFRVQINQLDTDKPVNNVELNLLNLVSGKVSTEQTDELGFMEIKLKKGDRFVLTLQLENYETMVDTIDTKTLQKDTIDYQKAMAFLPYFITGTCEMRGSETRVVGLKVVLQDETNNHIAETTTDKFGDFTFRLRAKHAYKVRMQTDSLLVRNGYFVTDSLTDNEPELRQTFKMDSKTVGSKIELNINFASGKSDLDSLTMLFIDREVVQLMKDNADVIFEFGAHTDSRGDARANEILSQKRADSAVKYVLSKGIPANQIKPVGYGESEIKNDCMDGVDCSDEEHAVNRRVEIKVLQLLGK